MTVPAPRVALFLRMAELLRGYCDLIPTDPEEIRALCAGWQQIRDEVVAEVDAIKEETP